MCLKKYLTGWSYQKVFVCLASIAGLLMLVITPPFEAPDEPNHFFRVYQIVQGGFFAERSGNVSGGTLPENLPQLVDAMTTTATGKIPFDPEKKFSKTTLVGGFSHYDDKGVQRFVPFPNTAAYPFLVYIPQVIGISLVGIFSQSLLLFFYGARLASLLFFVVSGYFILARTAKAYQELFFVSLMLPTVIFIASAISADTVSTVVSVGITAYVITQRSLGVSIDYKNFAIYAAGAFVLGLVKPVYALLVLLVFCVPGSLHYSRFKNIIIRLSLVTISFIGVVETLLIGKGTSTVMRTDVVTNPAIQLDYLMEHPFRFIVIAIHYLLTSAEGVIKHIIGIFGWNDTVLPSFGYWLGLGLIVFVVLRKSEFPEKRFAWWELLIVVGIVIGVVLAILVFLFLTWSPIGTSTIEGLQGRYFLPIVPLIFILIRELIPLRFNLSKQVLNGGIVALLVIAIVVLVQRFY